MLVLEVFHRCLRGRITVPFMLFFVVLRHIGGSKRESLWPVEAVRRRRKG